MSDRLVEEAIVSMSYAQKRTVIETVLYKQNMHEFLLCQLLYDRDKAVRKIAYVYHMLSMYFCGILLDHPLDCIEILFESVKEELQQDVWNARVMKQLNTTPSEDFDTRDYILFAKQLVFGCLGWKGNLSKSNKLFFSIIPHFMQIDCVDMLCQGQINLSRSYGDLLKEFLMVSNYHVINRSPQTTECAFDTDPLNAVNMYCRLSKVALSRYRSKNSVEDVQWAEEYLTAYSVLTQLTTVLMSLLVQAVPFNTTDTALYECFINNCHRELC